MSKHHQPSRIQRKIAGHRAGTAVSEKGQNTCRHILDTARGILATEDDTQFTMSKVASRAGIHLANLQYYFPTRERFLSALFDDTVSRYRDQWNLVLEGGGDDPMERLLALIDFQVDDAWDPATRGFFTHLWALASHDSTASEYLDQIYEWAIQLFSGLIASVNPKLSPQKRRSRAAIIMSMIDGQMLTTRPDKHSRRYLDQIKRDIKAAVYNIARARTT